MLDIVAQDDLRQIVDIFGFEDTLGELINIAKERSEYLMARELSSILTLD